MSIPDTGGIGKVPDWSVKGRKSLPARTASRSRP